MSTNLEDNRALLQELQGGLRVWRSQFLQRHSRRLEHFVSTRTGGVSPEPFRSLNLSFATGDDPSNVLANRKRLYQAIGVEPNRVTVARQTHGDNVVEVGLPDGGRGALEQDTAIPGADGLLTAVPGVCLMILVADCVPIILWDPVKSVAAVVHAGWRGTVEMVTFAAVTQMAILHGSQPDDVIAAIGPCIGAGDYRVGPDVVSQVQRSFPHGWQAQLIVEANGGGFFDLVEANRIQLIEGGLRPDRIEVSGISTFRAPDLFFSRRREGTPSGTFAAGVMIRT